jgi:hypothetical protein
MYAKRNFPTVLKDIGLFLAAPVIALSYLVLFPYFAVTMLRQVMREKRAARAAD